MKQTQRHDAIIDLVRRQGYVSTEELVDHFEVSPQTIRRDLNDLADQNKIQRHHGGAALPSSSENTAWQDRKMMWSAEKARIAERVASQIPDGATLLLISAPRRKRWRMRCSTTIICVSSPTTSTWRFC